ncbi:MAG: hypothetical protein ACHQ4H_17785, partial [Ktedonobacterales bacterium]
GSLFSGVPGMERFVPEPKELATAAVPALAGRGGGMAARNGRIAALAPPPSPPPAAPPAGGWRGRLKSMRDRMTVPPPPLAPDAKSPAETARAQNGHANGRVVDGSLATGERDQSAVTSNGTSNGTSGGAHSRRVRAARTGPVLVKPSQPTTQSQEEPRQTRESLPERQIAREATGLPSEVAAADAVSAGQTVAHNGNGAGPSSPRGGPGAQTRAATSARKPAPGRGPTTARKRSNRAKGSK